MKTAKKLFSLLLVAVLLFSALPFQAFADTTNQVCFLHNDGTTELVRLPVGSNGLVVGSVPTVNQVTDSYATMDIDYWEISNSSGRVATAPNAATFNFNTYAANFQNGFLWAKPVLKAKAHVHDFNDPNPTIVNATCTATGSKTYVCQNDEIPFNGAPCQEVSVETLPMTAHAYGAWTVVEEPTLTSTGLQSKSCTVCGHTITESISQAKETIVFKYRDAQGGEVFDVKQLGLNEKCTVANGKNVPEYNFIGWFDEDFNQLGDGVHGWNGENTVFYATYEEDPSQDNMSKITVKARIYNKGIAQNYDRTLLTSEYIDNGTRILDYLDSKESEIRAAINAINPEYKWDGYYYNDDLKTTLTGQEKVNGNKTVLIKVDVNPSNQVRVIVYRHDKVSTTPVPAYSVDGFAAGDTILLSDVQKAIKNATGRTYSLSTMYDDAEWTQLLDGEKVYGDARKIVPEGADMYVLHVVSTTYTGSSSTSKPASNPATGDNSMIEITAAVMLLAAAAVVTLTQLRKRKMI